MRVLVVNAGSSSLKLSVVGHPSGGETPGTNVEWAPGDDASAERVLERAMAQLSAVDADAVGYRVVHGGARYRAASVVDDQLIEEVITLDTLAPLHNRRAAATIRAGLHALPNLAHVACFDTAFHATLPEDAWRYPIPGDWVERLGIRRFGFHGLSVGWSTRRAAELLGRAASELRLIVAHLGSGSSVTAVDGGRSADTSMGFTPYEGLMMATRAGSIDPGILLRLAADGMSTETIADGLAQRSGLLAIAGVSDVREIERRAGAGDADATRALEMFVRRVAAGVAAATAAMPSLDALVFTGGIGEHSAAVRASVVRRLGPIGIPQRLERTAPDAILAVGPPSVLAITAREDLVIADEVRALVGAG